LAERQLTLDAWLRLMRTAVTGKPQGWRDHVGRSGSLGEPGLAQDMSDENPSFALSPNPASVEWLVARSSCTHRVPISEQFRLLFLRDLFPRSR
jgi:hypothetical protein